MQAVIVRACAKINLDLRVLGPRLDGYHELRTVFQSIALHDVIECVPREGEPRHRMHRCRRSARFLEPRLARGGGALARAAETATRP